MALQFRRGTAADVTSETFVPAAGEPVYLLDQDKLYVGDGATVGGNLVGGASDLNDLSDLHLTSQDVNTVQSYSISSNTVTLNTVNANNYIVNQQITITNSPVAVLNATHTIVGTPTANTLLFQLTAPDTGSTTTSGTITPVIPNKAVLAYNTTNNRFQDTKTSDIVGELKSHTDVNAYDTTSTGHALRYDYDSYWCIKRPGESIDFDAGTQYLGIDFTSGVAADSIYTANAANFTVDTTASNSRISVAGSYIPRTPYGDGLEDDDTYDITPTTAFVDSDDFTLDFWLLRASGQDWDNGMLFRDSSGNTVFSVEYDNQSLRLQSNLNSSGVSTGPILNTVYRWLVPDIDDEWIHICIQKEGNTNRAWFNGDDEGITSPQGTYGANFDFQFNRIATFAPIKYGAVDNAIGPLFFDLKKAWRPMVAGDITVPARPVDFYDLKSGVNLTELNDVNEFETFVDGDILTYYQDGFHKGKPFYSKYKFNLTSAPTGTLVGSTQVGTGSTGIWRPLTAAEYTNNNSEGPRTTTYNPTFDATVSAIGSFSLPEDGVYEILANVTVAMNNLTADTYYAHTITLVAEQTMRTSNERPYHLAFATNANAPTSIIRQTATIQSVERFDEGTIAVYLDTGVDQSNQFYVEQAYLTIRKVG